MKPPIIPADIAKSIKEYPYKDGEQMIWDFVERFACCFMEWEEISSGNGYLADGYAKKKFIKYRQLYEKENPRR